MVPNPPQNDKTLALIVGTPSTTVSAMVATKPGSGMTFPGSYEGTIRFALRRDSATLRLCLTLLAMGMVMWLYRGCDGDCVPVVETTTCQLHNQCSSTEASCPWTKSWTHPIIQRRPVGDHAEYYTLPERLDCLFTIEGWMRALSAVKMKIPRK
jgi:hypothetical protein